MLAAAERLNSVFHFGLFLFRIMETGVRPFDWLETESEALRQRWEVAFARQPLAHIIFESISMGGGGGEGNVVSREPRESSAGQISCERT